MNIVHVVTTQTINLPDEGTESYSNLYEEWYREEGTYLNEDGVLPTGDELIKNLAVYVSTCIAVGNWTHLLSGDDVYVETHNND